MRLVSGEVVLEGTPFEKFILTFEDDSGRVATKVIAVDELEFKEYRNGYERKPS